MHKKEYTEIQYSRRRRERGKTKSSHPYSASELMKLKHSSGCTFEETAQKKNIYSQHDSKECM